MKTFKEFIYEKKILKGNFLNYLEKEWLDPNGSLRRITNGEDSFGFHGTNREFDNFDMSFLREWRADEFLGKGIFLTPNRDVAEKYADAGSNNELPISILKDAEKIDKNLGDFMSSLYYKGNSTWRIPKFKWIYNNWKFPIDVNDVATLVNLIPNSQSEKDYNKDRNFGNDFVNIFATTSSALSQWTIRDLQILGLGDYNPKVYTIYIKGTESILISKSIKEIKTSNHDIVIAYDVPDLVKGIPEIIVKNVNLLRILKKDILNYDE